MLDKVADMSARDLYHSNIRNALIKDGWTITDDPLRLKWGKKDMYVDLAAHKRARLPDSTLDRDKSET